MFQNLLEETSLSQLAAVKCRKRDEVSDVNGCTAAEKDHAKYSQKASGVEDTGFELCYFQ